VEEAAWVQAGATIALFIAAFVAAYFAWRNLRVIGNSAYVQLFSELLKDLSNEEASHNRGLVREHIRSGMSIDEIKDLVEKGRKASAKIRKSHLTGQYLKDIDIGDKELQGIALERTIASFERIAFFLLENDKKLRMKPPEWLWTMVNDFWCRLHYWIEYRQSCTDDIRYYQKGYGINFERLANIAPRG
jgi:hypothetical protein